MKRLLLIALGVLGFVPPAIAGEEVFSSLSGQTNFQAPIVTACYGSGDRVVRYNTTYRGVPYEGYLWVQDIAGCRTSRVSMQGYFEERNDARNQWCKGNLTLRFNGSRGVAEWRSISAQPGYRCSGSGQSFTVQLVQTGP